jgi:hypothetical protein
MSYLIFCRLTKSLYYIALATDEGLDPTGGEWVTICEKHRAILNSRTKRQAEAAARYPDFCADCQPVLRRVADCLADRVIL